MINITNSKERLLKDSRALLAERSIDDVGVREIARASVVNVSAIFYHFDGKSGLIMAIVEQFIFENMMPVIYAFRANAISGMPAPVVLSKLLEDLVTLYDENKETVFIIMNVNESSDKILREKVSNPILNLFGELVTFLKDQQPSRIPQVEAYLILSPLLQIVRNERYHRSFFPLSADDPVFVRNLCDEIVRKTFS